MRRSKIFKFIIPTFAVAALAACGGDTSTSDSAKSTETTAVENQTTDPKPAPNPEPAGQSTESKKELSTEEALLKRGKIVWFKCRSCHETSVDGPHKVGPNIHNIMGATAGVKEGFVFSDAMKNSGIVWTDEALDAFIERPAAYVKGTKMAFVGVRKEYDRQAVIAYIKENARPDN